MSKATAYPSGRARRIPAWGTARHNALLGVTALAVGLAVALLPPEAAVALVVGAVLLILIAIEPMAGLVITLSVAPLKTLIETEAEINLPADVGQIALAVTVGVWFARRVADRRGTACRALLPSPLVGFQSSCAGEGQGVRGFSPVFLPLLLYIFVSALSIIDAPATGAGLRELLKWVEVALVAALTVDLVGGDRNRLRWVVWAMLVAGAAHALIGLYEFFGGSGAAHLAILGGRYYRAFGSFGQPNPFAGFLGLCLTLALGAAWGALTEWFSRFPRLTLAPARSAGEPWANLRVFPLTPGPSPTRGEGSQRRLPVPPPLWGRRLGSEGQNRDLLGLAAAIVYAVLAALIAGGLLASWSRGAWMGVAAAGVVMTLFLPRRLRHGLMLVGALVALAALMWASGKLPSAVVERITDFTNLTEAFGDVRGVDIDDENYAEIERFAHWQAALSMARARPWLGVGFGNYPAAYPDHALMNWPDALGHAHNYYLNALAETGLLGLGAYLLVWVVVIGLTWGVLGRAEIGWWERGVALGLMGAWTHLAIHSLLDKLYVNNVFLHVGVLLGILAVLHAGKSGISSRRGT